ncbi:hypothetical protein OPV22_029082 [Ensete ventricosum]|uniref:VQ domain-containing protein n=1 Tax=Ensete ventricosum TaxID=4639 RepID=A0AAV8PWH6_ENSVE|nr:hypothetical protein OPV22_029082 [Ensete ventricosum]RWW02529.1 hypothetical protein GW17_00034379 [Ensete ventricosum]RWW85181.1 hypothetical protein BHE74_00006164 [Ensete ventricosum]RZR77842.1 hypothetical protein BHM03_00003043 [Ensete ventricosum]
MADNCSVLDPWVYHSESAWISEVSARENAAVTRALQISLSDTTTTSSSSSASADTLSSPLLVLHHQFTPPSSSSASGDATLRLGNALGPTLQGRVSKRKSDASKRSATTYISADPTNFREVVQRATGFRLAGEPLVKPEPVRSSADDRAALQQIRLPTLDTSLSLLDTGAVGIPRGGFSYGPPPPADAPDFDFYPLLPAFPTLDSWGAM